MYEWFKLHDDLTTFEKWTFLSVRVGNSLPKLQNIFCLSSSNYNQTNAFFHSWRNVRPSCLSLRFSSYCFLQCSVLVLLGFSPSSISSPLFLGGGRFLKNPSNDFCIWYVSLKQTGRTDRERVWLPTNRPGYREFCGVGNQAFSCSIIPYASLLKQEIAWDKNNFV